MRACRVSSSRVVLTATFLALAAGGTAACDDPTDEDWDSATVYEDTSYQPGGSGYSGPDDVEDEEPMFLDDGSEVFYCADEDGEIVDEDLCAEPAPGVPYLLWHSTGYDRDLKPGMSLDGGDHFAPGDRASRRAFKLPATGRVPNGTIKTNVVGSGSRGSSGSTGGGSGWTDGASSGG